MSRLLDWIEAKPELAPSLIGIAYSDYRQLLEQLEGQSQTGAPSTPEDAARKHQLSSQAIGSPSIHLAPPLPSELLHYEFAITASSHPQDVPLSPANQLLLVLFCLHQTWTQSMARKLGISEAAVLAAYFGTQESTVDQLFFTCVPMVEAVLSHSQSTIDRSQAYRRLLNATGFAHDAQERLQFLQTLGFSPSHIFDVGASNGSWSRVVHQLFPEAHFYLFEPLAPFSDAYQQGLDFVQSIVDCTLFPYALGKECGTATITIDQNPAASSLLTVQGSRELTTQDIQMMTLDTVVQQESLPHPQLIKLDTQGYELNILQGAQKTLQHVEVLMVESWLTRGYGAQTPLLLELAAWLDKHDFCLFDFGGSYRNESGILISPDCYFVKRSSTLANQGFDRKLKLREFDGEI